MIFRIKIFCSHVVPVVAALVVIVVTLLVVPLVRVASVVALIGVVSLSFQKRFRKYLL